MVNMAALMGGLIIFIIIIWFSLIALGILAFVLWILMIIDVAKRKFKQENDRVMWILILVFTGIIGAIIYYFIVKKPNKH